MKNQNACKKYADKLVAYVLDELAREEREQIGEHIVTCEECTGEVDLLNAAADKLRSAALPVEGLDRERKKGLMEVASKGASNNGKNPRKAWWPVWWQAVAAAAILILTTGGIVFLVLTDRERNEAGKDSLVAVKTQKIDESLLRKPVNTNSARPEQNAATLSTPAQKPDTTPTIPKNISYDRLSNKELNHVRVVDLYAAGSGGGGGNGYTRMSGAVNDKVQGWSYGAHYQGQPLEEFALARFRQTELHSESGRLAGGLQSSLSFDGRGRLPQGILINQVIYNLASNKTMDAEQRIQKIFELLSPRPKETPDMMFFRYYGDNPFLEAGADPLSTFSVDVDTASYTLVRNYLSRGHTPPKAAVRTEEFINYFKSGYKPPKKGDFAIHTELVSCPFGKTGQHRYLRIGIKAREIPLEKRRPCALVFVIDVSGSMKRENRLGLVKQSLKILVNKLDERDTIGIVTFNTTGRKVMEPLQADQKDAILEAIDSLHAGGSTNAGEGLQIGYKMASSHFAKGANNRVVLCSDGVANTGSTEPEAILDLVGEHRKNGIFLTSIGCGMGNHNDALLEQLADKGDGQCVYLDTLKEARRFFTQRLTGALETIAKDAKVQVAFDPEKVAVYRLLGYENRAIADKDFRNDQVDAGEIGAGHEVTALYEVLPAEGAKSKLATVTLRYKPVRKGSAIKKPVELSADISLENAIDSFKQAGPRFRLSAVVAEFAEILRQSHWARDNSPEALLAHAEPLVTELDGEEEVVQLVALIKQASRLPGHRGELTKFVEVLDEIKENNILREKLRRLQEKTQGKALSDLKQENEKLRDMIRKLLVH